MYQVTSLCPYVIIFHHFHTALQLMCLCPQVLSYKSMSLCHDFSSYSHSTSSYVAMSSCQVVSMGLCHVFSSYSHSHSSHVSTVYVPKSSYVFKSTSQFICSQISLIYQNFHLTCNLFIKLYKITFCGQIISDDGWICYHFHTSFR